MVALVRETYNDIQQNRTKIPESEQAAIEKLLSRKNEVLAVFKKMYSKKLDVVKIRIHGTLSLAQILLTGRDLAIHDFGGIPSRSYSEARIKRSPFWDVAFMIRSYYYAGYEGFLSSPHIKKEEIKNLLPFAQFWIHYMSGFFLKAYFEAIEQSNFIPKSSDDLTVMLQNYLLEKALYALKYELTNRPEKVAIPLAMINDILN